jgi:two-component system phosphate regulon response regulator PhoB
MKIAIIEDEWYLAELLSFNLESEGFRTCIATDGRSGMELVTSELPGLVILDLMLPEINGIEVCRSLRKQPATRTTPIIMLTAKGEEIDRVVGFEVGADDYLVKPFSIRELLHRIRAILRRISLDQTEDKVISVGSVVVDTLRHLVTVSGEEVSLTTTEFKLLLTLAVRLGRMQSREHLLREVWGYSHMADSRTVDTHITRLRNKLGTASTMIRTVRGFGYKIEE